MNDTKTTTAREVIDILTFTCYKANRERSPHISPQRWEESGIFPKGLVQKMERKLEDEWLMELYDEMGDMNPQFNLDRA